MADAYRDLIVWRKATQLALHIYRSTQLFPKDELYGLTSQMQRAAVSVASNIAEGKDRYSRKEFVQFLCHARGSLTELETAGIHSPGAQLSRSCRGAENRRPSNRTRANPKWPDGKHPKKRKHIPLRFCQERHRDFVRSSDFTWS